MPKPKLFSLQDIFFFVFLVLLSAIFYEMLQPFLIDLFLTLVLTIMFHKVYVFFKKKPKISPSLAATVTIIIIVFTLVIPLSFVGVMVTQEVSNNYEMVKSEWPKIEQYFQNDSLRSILDKQPKSVKNYIEKVDMNKLENNVEELVTNVSRTMIGVVQETVLSFTSIVFHLLMIVFFLFFFFVDGETLQQRLQYLIPFDDKNEEEFMSKMKDVTEAIIFNTFLVGVIEGTWGGILLAIAGVPSPFFWGTMMVLMSIIPLVGANSILFPIALVLIFIGNVWEGIMIIVLGSGLITVNQNFIKPRLDGQRSGMHPAIVVISSLGGLFWMGLVGFLAGPFLAAAFLVIWDQFGKKYERQLVQLNAGEEEDKEQPTSPPFIPDSEEEKDSK